MPPNTYGYEEEGADASSVRDWALWRRILGYTRAYRPQLALAITLAMTVSLAGLVMPQLMQRGIDDCILATHLPSDVRMRGLARIVLAYGGLVLLVFCCTFAQMVLLEWVGQSVMHRMRQDLFEHLMRLDLGFFHGQPAGRLVTRLTNDIQNMHEMFTSVMVVLFNEALKLAGVFVFLFWMNAGLALLMLLFAPAALAATWFFSRAARRAFRDIRVQLAKINSFLAEHLTGMAVIRAFGAEAASLTRFRGLNDEYLGRCLTQIRVFGIFLPLAEMLSTCAIAVIIWHGGGEAVQGRLTIGELTAFLAYMRLFFQPLRELAQNYSIVQAAMASAERIFETLDAKPTLLPLLPRNGFGKEALTPLPPSPGGRGGKVTPLPLGEGPGVRANGAPPPTGLSVSFRDITFGYQTDAPVLHDISLEIAPGETVALVGATGAGKTSLASLLARFYDPQAGQVLLDGRDIRALPQEALRRRLGLVLQDVFIMPDTVRANIILDQPPDVPRLTRILEQTGLVRFIDRLPRGLDTVIGEGARSLSLGEQQMLAFVRALYRDPEVLILDEATASIDAESESLLEEALVAGFSGRTVLVIAHRLATVSRADRIVVMDQGRIVETGTHAELLARDSRYRELVTLDQGREG